MKVKKQPMVSHINYKMLWQKVHVSLETTIVWEHVERIFEATILFSESTKINYHKFYYISCIKNYTGKQNIMSFHQNNTCRSNSKSMSIQKSYLYNIEKTR